MTPARPIPTVVRRIVPVLGSSVDGEALGAARAIGRVLDGAGLGFVDLAEAIPTADFRGAAKVVSAPTQPDPCAGTRFSRRRENSGDASRIRPFDTYAWRRAYTPKQEADHRARVQYCLDHPSRLTAWERSFLASVSRLAGNLSIGQGDALSAIADRLSNMGRCA